MILIAKARSVVLSTIDIAVESEGDWVAVVTMPIINPDNSDFGAVVNCAIRYCLGRQTYMPNLVVDFVSPLLSYIDNRTLNCLERDIKEAVNTVDYGDEQIDKPMWLRFYNDILEEQERRK